MAATDDFIPLKQAEIAVRRFNDMAIPHHLNVLKSHRANIEKGLQLADWDRIKREEIKAMHVIKQIKNLLLEMDALRDRISNEDVERFDEMMDEGKQKAFNAMKEFLELQLKTPAPLKSNNKILNNSTRNRNDDDDDDDDKQSNELGDLTVEISSTQMYQKFVPQIESNFQAEQFMLMKRQACLDELQHLQDEILHLNGMFHNMGELVQKQAENVKILADNAEEALENVQIGEQNLRRALTYKKAMYPVMGALLGTCVGGPIGLVAGLKVGSLAAVGCGLLGFTGGKVLKSSADITHGNIIEEQDMQQYTEQIELPVRNE